MFNRLQEQSLVRGLTNGCSGARAVWPSLMVVLGLVAVCLALLFRR